MFFRKFYSLKSYRFTIKLFSLIVKNASSFLDFYSLFFILLFFILYSVILYSVILYSSAGGFFYCFCV
ncbi:hypothetical protein BXP08_02680 [Helicobacter pylori]|nr:hypothetical protein BXP08_02680 [Helicobacter pylori]